MSTSVRITRARSSEGTFYKSSMTPRNTTFVHRTPSDDGRQAISRSVQRSMSYGQPSIAPQVFSTITTTGVNNVRESRVREKKDMQDLNERFASYIEKVRFLEAQNRRLADELEKLKSKWGKETSAVKAMYQAELGEARCLLDKSEKEKSRLEIGSSSLEEQKGEFRLQIEDLHSQSVSNSDLSGCNKVKLSDYEAEITILLGRAKTLSSDHEKDKNEIAHLKKALDKSRIDLDIGTLNHIDAENRRQTLEEDIQFTSQVHEQETKELAALAYRDSTEDSRKFWKSEMSQALREIQETYDEKLKSMRGDLESTCHFKLQEMRTGVTRQNSESGPTKEDNVRLKQQLTDIRIKLNDLEAAKAQLEYELQRLHAQFEEEGYEFELESTGLRNDMATLRAKMEATIADVESLFAVKLGLELEIAAYRKLLEGEETRTDLQQIITSILSSSSQRLREDDAATLKANEVVRGEMSAKTTYQKGAKGPIAISECSPDGKFVLLENTGRKDEAIGNWVLTRIVDGHEMPVYSFDSATTIKSNGCVKVWAADSRPTTLGQNDLAYDGATWGVGTHVITKLANSNKEEKASHIQKTVYSSQTLGGAPWK